LARLKWFQAEVLKKFILPMNRTGFFADAHYEIPGGKLPDDKLSGLQTNIFQPKMCFDGLDNRPIVRKLFDNLKAELPTLEILLEDCRDPWGYEDRIYRFYHQSFKVFSLQKITGEIMAKLQALLPGVTLNDWFMEIVQEGTGKTFAPQDNKNWPAVTRPIIEAFFHARFFLEMAVKYGKELESPPRMLPSGWAAFLYLFNLR
jgi:hypothetical protein